jgi:hypothetical protein
MTEPTRELKAAMLGLYLLGHNKVQFFTDSLGEWKPAALVDDGPNYCEVIKVHCEYPPDMNKHKTDIFPWLKAHGVAMPDFERSVTP